MIETGKCPHCGGESNGMIMYSDPLQTQCKDCGKNWGFGEGIKVLSGNEAIRKRPGMYFIPCFALGSDEIHLVKPSFDDSTRNRKTLCGLNEESGVCPSIELSEDTIKSVCFGCQRNMYA